MSSQYFSTPMDEAESFDDIRVHEELVPGEQSHGHMRKKALIAYAFEETGGHAEFEKHGSGLIFDVFIETSEGLNIVAEVGEINTPHRKFEQRLRRTYEHADILLWWPNGPLQMPLPESYFDAMLELSECEICHEAGDHPLTHTLDTFPLDFDGVTIPVEFELEHLFEPTLFHERFDIEQQDDQSTLSQFI